MAKTGRLYAVTMNAVAVSAAQDLFNVTCTASMAVRIRELYLGQKTLTTAEMRQIKCQRFPATVTAGSGGSAATPRPLINGDPAATFTARINDTTGMTTNSTAVDLYDDVWYYSNQSLIWLPRDEGPILTISQGFTVNLPTAPSGSMTCSGTLIVEELL